MSDHVHRWLEIDGPQVHVARGEAARSGSPRRHRGGSAGCVRASLRVRPSRRATSGSKGPRAGRPERARRGPGPITDPIRLARVRREMVHGVRRWHRRSRQSWKCSARAPAAPIRATRPEPRSLPAARRPPLSIGPSGLVSLISGALYLGQARRQHRHGSACGAAGGAAAPEAGRMAERRCPAGSEAPAGWIFTANQRSRPVLGGSVKTSGKRLSGGGPRRRGSNPEAANLGIGGGDNRRLAVARGCRRPRARLLLLPDGGHTAAGSDGVVDARPRSPGARGCHRGPGSQVAANGELSDQSLRRLIHGIVLHRQGLAPLIVLSGVVRDPGPSEADAGRRRTSPGRSPGSGHRGRRGRPDHAGRGPPVWHPSSWRTMESARILLVTDDTHMARADAVFRRAGFTVLPAPVGNADPPIQIVQSTLTAGLAWLYYRLWGYKTTRKSIWCRSSPFWRPRSEVGCWRRPSGTPAARAGGGARRGVSRGGIGPDLRGRERRCGGGPGPGYPRRPGPGGPSLYFASLRAAPRRLPVQALVLAYWTGWNRGG